MHPPSRHRQRAKPVGEKNVLVSVIVPLYNKGPYIQRTLESILAQTYREYEVIVVNDGSSDGGDEIVRRCADPRVRLVAQKNAGPGAARNYGLAEAQGSYTAFLDADDEWLPTFLEKSVSLLERFGPEVACVSSGYFLHPPGRSTASLWQQRGLRDGVYHLTPELSPQFVVYLLAYLGPCNTLARTERVRRWGGFFDREKCVYGEDSYLWLKVLLNESIAVNVQPLVRYHTEASTLSHNLRGPRPIEPLLRDPDELTASCPRPLLPLLNHVLALRAIRTACMLGYWGEWREARALLHRFCNGWAYRQPQFAIAQLVASPLGAGALKTWRLVRVGLAPAFANA